MGRRLGRAFVELETRDGKLTAGLGRAERRVNRWTRSAGKLIGGLRTAGLAAAKGVIALGTAATATGAALIVIGKRSAEATDELAKLERQTGIASETLQALRIATDFGGASSDALVKATRRLARAIKDAADGQAEYLDTFNLLKIEVRDANGNLRKTEDVLRDIGIRFSQMEDDTLKAAIAQELLGRSGQELVPFLETYEATLASAEEALQKYGFVLGETDKLQAELFVDNNRRLGVFAEGIREKIGTNVVNALVQAQEATLDWIEANKEFIHSGIDRAFAEAAEQGRRFIDAVGNKDGVATAEDLAIAMDKLAESLVKIGNASQSTIDLINFILSAREKLGGSPPLISAIGRAAAAPRGERLGEFGLGLFDPFARIQGELGPPGVAAPRTTRRPSVALPIPHTTQTVPFEPTPAPSLTSGSDTLTVDASGRIVGRGRPFSQEFLAERERRRRSGFLANERELQAREAGGLGDLVRELARGNEQAATAQERGQRISEESIRKFAAEVGASVATSTVRAIQDVNARAAFSG